MDFVPGVGEYAGFDENAMTCDNGGKGRACGYLKRQHHYENLVMIGDGSTDLEAAPPAVSFPHAALFLSHFLYFS